LGDNPAVNADWEETLDGPQRTFADLGVDERRREPGCIGPAFSRRRRAADPMKKGIIKRGD
jgi:hypothetical protein